MDARTRGFTLVDPDRMFDKDYALVMDYVKEMVIKHINTKRKVYKYVDTVKIVDSKDGIYHLTFTAKENANDAEEQTYVAAISALDPILEEFVILECSLKPDGPAPGYTQPQGMEKDWPPLKECPQYKYGMINLYMQKFPWEDYLSQSTEEEIQNKLSCKPCDMIKFLYQVRYSRGYELDVCVPRYMDSPFIRVDSSELLSEHYAPLMDRVKEIIIEHMNTKTGKVYKYVDTIKLVDTENRIFLLTFTAKENANDAEEQTYYAAIDVPCPRNILEDFEVLECFLKPDGPAPGYPRPQDQDSDEGDEVFQASGVAGVSKNGMEKDWPPLKECPQYKYGMINLYMQKFSWEDYLSQSTEEEIQNKLSCKPCDMIKFLYQVRYYRGYELDVCVPGYMDSPFIRVDSSELLSEHYAPLMDHVKEIIIEHMNTKTGKVYKYVDTVKLVDTENWIFLLTFTAKENANDAEEQTYYAAVDAPCPRNMLENFEVLECFLKPDGPAPGYPQPQEICPCFRKKKGKKKGRGKEKNHGGSSTRRVHRVR